MITASRRHPPAIEIGASRSPSKSILLHVAVPNTDALYASVIDRLTERPEVADVNTSVVYEHLRSYVVQPLR